MKLLEWHCEELKYVDTIPSNRPSGITEVIGEKIASSFSNVLAVFTCIEDGDSEDEVLEAVESVLSALERLGGNREVVIIPFAHLSSNLAPPKVATELLSRLISCLSEQGIKTHFVSFGYHKDFELRYRGHGHPGSVSFRSFPRIRNRTRDIKGNI